MAVLEKKESFIKSKIQFRDLLPIVILLGIIGVLSLFNSSFLTIQSMKNIMLQVSAIGVVSFGALVTILSGGIDFTSGYGVAMIGMVAAFFYKMPFSNNSFYVYIVVSLIVGLMLGLTNGLIISKLNILPFIATLATMSICQGISLAIGNGAMTLFRDSSMAMLGQGYLASLIPYSFIVFILMALLTSFLLNRTRFGVYLYALGGDENSARYMGINISFYKTLAYVYAGFCTAVGSILTVSKISMTTPSIYGTILMDGIAATVIGGTSMAGGKGRVFSTIIGSLIIVVIGMALAYLNIQAELQKVFKGSVILIAVCIDAYYEKFANKNL
jgi:ribose/xylose/arabinose/galactoside ABC-type transport system permease subunit